MALNKRQLIEEIEQALIDMSANPPADDARRQYAEDLAEAIDKFVKTGKVRTEDGDRPVK